MPESKAKRSKIPKQARTAKQSATPDPEPAAPDDDDETVSVRRGPEPAALESRLLAPLAEIERVLGELRRRDWLNPSSWEWPRLPEMPALFEHRVPSVDVIERDKEILVRAEVPGVERDDLEVSLAERTLTIHGATRSEAEHHEGDLHRREIRTGAFSRVVSLPADVDAAKAKARYRDGVLTLKLPKRRSARRQNIAVD